MKFAGSLSEAEKEKARYEIIGVPFDSNAFKKGTRYGPKAIRKASQLLETFIWDYKLELSDLLYYDSGDVMLERNFKSSVDVGTRRRKIFIGGDHSISYPLVKALFERDEVAKVIVIDAHADSRDSYKSNKLSNACVMRRIAELIGFENILQIGVRSSSEAEYRLIKDRLRIYDAAMLKEKGVDGILEEIGSDNEKTYLSIDIDALDPGIAPGVDNPEPCGLSLESLIALVRGLIKGVNVVASDVVEVNPKRDNNNGITSINASRLIFEILASYSDNVSTQKHMDF